MKCIFEIRQLWEYNKFFLRMSLDSDSDSCRWLTAQVIEFDFCEFPEFRHHHRRSHYAVHATDAPDAGGVMGSGLSKKGFCLVSPNIWFDLIEQLSEELKTWALNNSSGLWNGCLGMAFASLPSFNQDQYLSIKRVWVSRKLKTTKKKIEKEMK